MAMIVGSISSIMSYILGLGAMIKLIFGAVGKPILPPIPTTTGGLQWLEEWIQPPRRKQKIQKLRSTHLDGVLCSLRGLATAALLNIIAFGEGSSVVVRLLGSEVRQVAHMERHVTEADCREL
jgi:hypothetical protein